MNSHELAQFLLSHPALPVEDGTRRLTAADLYEEPDFTCIELHFNASSGLIA